MRVLATLAVVPILGLAACGKPAGDAVAKAKAPTYTAEQAAGIRAAAEKGDALSQFKVGRMYATGDGAPEDTTEAVLWYRKAADQGLADAQSALGEAYLHGVGVAASEKEAGVWFEKAAQQGNVQAMKGFAYTREQDLDPAMARKWYEKAAEAGDAEAQAEVASLYMFGWETSVSNFMEIKSEVKMNASRAAYWYEKATSQGLCSNAGSLAFLYKTGGMGSGPSEGNMPTDPLVAYKWAQVELMSLPDESGRKAFEARSKTEDLVAELQNVLTSAQEAEGERQAKDFLARVKCRRCRGGQSANAD